MDTVTTGESPAGDHHQSLSALIFEPTPMLTVTAEPGSSSAEDSTSADVHLHPGGQGVWVARMLKALGLDTHLCAPLGGETGEVLKTLINAEGLKLCQGPTTTGNGVSIHDRREGEPALLAKTEPAELARHEVDDLFSAALASGMATNISVLAGP